MAKQISLFQYTGVNAAVPVSFLPADTTTLKTVLTAGSNDTNVEMFTATSTDTVAQVIAISHFDGTTSRLIATMSIPALSGSDGSTPAVNLLNSALWPGLLLDRVSKPYYAIKAGSSIKCNILTTVTTAKAIVISAVGFDF